MNETILKCDLLSVGYEKKAIVNDINFEVHSGEIVSVIGANGVGKSTLLKTVAGLLTPVAGTVYMQGEAIDKMNANQRAKNMSLLLTDKIQADYMTAYDVVATGRYAYTGSLGFLSLQDKEAIEVAMEAVSMKDIQDKQFLKLSDGQKQRVMLARAICQEPKVIVLDEPTSFLDIGYKLEIMMILQKLKERGVAILMTMHDLDIAKKVSDRVIGIKAGKVDKIGTADEMFDTDYICELFGVDVEQYKEFYVN